MEIIDGEGRTTKVERNDKGLPTKIIRPDDSYVLFEYDIDENNMVNNDITYDLIRKIEYDPESEEEYVTEWWYDSYGNIFQGKDVNGNFSYYSYSDYGLLKSEKNPLGQIISYEYYNDGLLYSKTNHLGIKNEYTYGPYGNTLSVKISGPPDYIGSKTNFIRDTAGNITSVINANGKATVNEYEFLTNRLLSVTTPEGEKTQYFYLDTGELEKIIDPAEKISQFFYDSLGRVIKKIDPLDMETDLFYDRNGNVVKEIDPNGNQKIFRYNKINQLTEKIITLELTLLINVWVQKI